MTRIDRLRQQQAARRRPPEAPEPTPTPRIESRPVYEAEPDLAGREDTLRTLVTGMALPSLEPLPDEAPDFVDDQYRERFKDLLTAVNGRLLAMGGAPLVASDWRLRGRYDPVPGDDALTVGSMNDLLLVADDLGIDISTF